MRFIAILLLLFTSLAHAQPMSVPREYWKESVSVAEAELAAEGERSAFIEKVRSLDYVFDGSGTKVPINPALRARLIQSADAFSLRGKEGWQMIKAMYRAGDKIYKFAWPPLSGPVGYILVRDNKIIHTAIVANQ